MNIYVIRWSGPFDKNEAIDNENLTNGIYAGIGIKKHLKYNKENIKLRYIGKTKNSLKVRLRSYDKIHMINRELSIWFGKVVNTEIFNLLEIEHMFISFSEMEDTLNEKNTVSYPKTKCIVISEFTKADGSIYSRLPKVVRCIPEVIIWNPELRQLRYSKRLYIDYNPKDL